MDTARARSARTAGDVVFPVPVDGVEVKFSFSGDRAGNVRDAFDLADRSAARTMTVSFLDARPADGGRPRLLAAGLVLRLRHVVDHADESTLKLRPAAAERLTDPWRAGTHHDDGYRLEYDWGTRPVLAASLDHELRAERIRDVVAGDRPARDAFSDEQEALLRECGPRLAAPFDDLGVAGPVRAHRWDLEVPGLAGSPPLRAEQWEYAGDRRFVELSVRVPAADAADCRARLADLLDGRRLTPDRGATTKTETVLLDLLP
jgi:hypothetical protein